MTAFDTAWGLVKGDLFSPHIPRKVDAEAIIEAYENPDLIGRFSQLPKPENLLDIPEFEEYDYSDEGRFYRNQATRNWMMEQDRPAYNYPIKPPVGSLYWNDTTYTNPEMWELNRIENIPINSPDTRWSEGITEDASGPYSWRSKLEQGRHYADFWNKGYRPPPIRSVLNLSGNQWRHEITDGHHRGVMSNLLGLDSLIGKVGLTGRTKKNYTRGITPRDLEEFYDLARDAL